MTSQRMYFLLCWSHIFVSQGCWVNKITTTPSRRSKLAVVTIGGFFFWLWLYKSFFRVQRVRFPASRGSITSCQGSPAEIGRSISFFCFPRGSQEWVSPLMMIWHVQGDLDKICSSCLNERPKVVHMCRKIWYVLCTFLSLRTTARAGQSQAKRDSAKLEPSVPKWTDPWVDWAFAKKAEKDRPKWMTNGLPSNTILFDYARFFGSVWRTSKCEMNRVGRETAIKQDSFWNFISLLSRNIWYERHVVVSYWDILNLSF